MIKIIGHELTKIAKSRLVLTVLSVALLLNAVILAYICNRKSVMYEDSAALSNEHTEMAEEYPAVIESIISQAESNLKEFDLLNFTYDDYNVKYQNLTVTSYTEMKNSVRFSPSPVSGWDIYFGYTAGNIFILCTVLIIGIFIFTQDHIAGMYAIIYSTKNGRRVTGNAKIIVSTIITVGICSVFVIENLAVISIFYNFSSPLCLVQNIRQFYLCPYKISILLLFFVSFLMKLLSALVFCFAVDLISVILKNYALIYVSGLGVLCLNLVLHSVNYINPDSLLRNANLIAVIEGSLPFERLWCVNLFGKIVHLHRFLLMLYLILALASAFVVVIRYSCTVHRIKSFNLSMLFYKFIGIVKKLSRMNSPTPIRRKSYTLSLYKWELYKLMHSRRAIAVMTLLTLLKIAVSCREYEPLLSYSDAVYREYMTAIQGEADEEKVNFLQSERLRIDETISSFGEVQSGYFDGQVDAETYRVRLDEYNAAVSRSPVLERVEAHANYIEKMKSAGESALFVYDTGWLKLFFAQFDWVLYTAVLFLAAGIFASEHSGNSSSGGFAQVLRTSYNGRGRTFRAKYAVAVTVNVLIFAVFHLTDLIFLLSAYELPLPNAPIQSIEALESVGLDVTIFGFYVTFLLVKLMSVVILAVVICSLSELLPNVYATLTAAAAVSGFPHVMSMIGVEVFARIDYVLLMEATPFITGSNQMLYIAVLLMFSFVLMLFAKRKWYG